MNRSRTISLNAIEVAAAYEFLGVANCVLKMIGQQVEKRISDLNMIEDR